MDKQFWLKKWEVTEIGFNQPKPHALLVQYFNGLNLAPNARVFVPLCGKSIDMLWLAKQGCQVVGIELSDIACEAFFTEHQLPYKMNKVDELIIYESPDITLICGDYFKLTQAILGHVDAIYDRAALIALPDDLRKRYVAHLFELISLKTKIFLISLIYHQSDMEGPPFVVSEKEVNDLYGKNSNIKKICSEEIKKIAPHLKAKGLKKAFEEAYYMGFLT